MKDRHTITIAVLAVTAALLLAAVVLTGRPQPAAAAQAQSLGSRYTMIAAQVSSQQDVLYVMDHDSEQVIAYIPERNLRSRDILVVGSRPIDLAALVEAAQQQLRTPRR